MWSAKIVEKKFKSGVPLISVSFSDEMEDFIEVIQVSDSTALNDVINNRLKALENTKTFVNQIALGVFTPVEKIPTVTVPTAIQKLNELARLVDLGVIQKIDTEYTDAVAAVQADRI